MQEPRPLKRGKGQRGVGLHSPWCAQIHSLRDRAGASKPPKAPSARLSLHARHVHSQDERTRVLAILYILYEGKHPVHAAHYSYVLQNMAVITRVIRNVRCTKVHVRGTSVQYFFAGNCISLRISGETTAQTRASTGYTGANGGSSWYTSVLSRLSRSF